MPKLAFRERLQQDKPLLADGAMGTQLLEKGGLSLTTCFDHLNLTHPELVRSVHEAYIQAGSDLIETNTFGSNRFKLAEHGLGEQVQAINQAAVRLARQSAQAAPRAVYIAGSIGPLGVAVRPYGKVTKEAARNAFIEQMRAMVSVGVDVFLLETFPNHNDLLLAIDAAKAVAPDMPIIAQATFSTDSLTYTGDGPARVAHDLHRAGVDVLGANCGGGPSHLSTVLESMTRATPTGVFSAMPNAGFPEVVGGRALYSASASYFEDYTRTLTGQGARIIGGCCGTTPAHIAAMRKALDTPQNPMPQVEVLSAEEDEADDPTPQTATYLSQRLAEGRFTITVEMTPPRSYSADKLLHHARLLSDAGADLIDVADTPAAKMKMSAWAVSHLLQDRVGMETVLHFPTRGRNILRVQGDLLAAHALGLRNLFVTMGDPTRIGDYPEATDSYDIVPSKLIALVKGEMNAGRDMAGNSIGKPTSFTVGCALNMAADDLDRELKVLDKKLAAGADFALGQAVFDPPRIDAFLQRYEETHATPFDLPVIMGVIPLRSLGQARFLHNEVPGISIPDAIFKRLEEADERGDDAAVEREGLRIAQELMQQMRDRVQGAYIIPSVGRYDLAAELVNAIAMAPVGI